MCSAHLVQHRLSRLETEVVGIVQAELASGLGELVVGETFEGRLSGDRHEDWERHRAMREMERAGSGFGGLEMSNN